MVLAVAYLMLMNYRATCCTERIVHAWAFVLIGRGPGKAIIETEAVVWIE